MLALRKEFDKANLSVRPKDLVRFLNKRYGSRENSILMHILEVRPFDSGFFVDIILASIDADVEVTKMENLSGENVWMYMPYASNRADYEVLLRMVNDMQGSEIINNVNDQGNTALHFAANADDNVLVKFLLKNGGNEYVVNKKGSFPAQLCKSDECKKLFKPVVLKAVSNAVSAGKNHDKPSWRLELAKKIADKTIKVEYPACDVSQLYGLNSLAKNSASTTGIFVGKHVMPGDNDVNDRDILMKASFELVSKEAYSRDNSLPLEVINYRLIANAMIENQWTPHIATYIASFKCDHTELAKLSNEAEYAILYQAMYGFEYEKQKCPSNGKPKSVYCAAMRDNNKWKATKSADKKIVYGDLFDTGKIQFMMTEKIVGKTLANWMQEDHTIEAWKSVLFQTLYTLECFNRIGFRHNDLHLSNIFIVESETPDTCYVIDDNKDTYLKVPTKGHSVRIYDFDRSVLVCENGAHHVKYQPLIDAYYEAVADQGVSGCKNTRIDTTDLNKQSPFFRDCEAGACQEINPKYDAFTVLGDIWGSYPINDLALGDVSGLNFGGVGRDEKGNVIVDKATGKPAYPNKNKIPVEVIKFIERHIHTGDIENAGVTESLNPLTFKWSWAMRVSKLQRDANAQLEAGHGNYILPDTVMDPVDVMLHDRSFFDFDRRNIKDLYDDCKMADQIYHLPLRASAPRTSEEFSASCTLKSQRPKLNRQQKNKNVGAILKQK